MTSTCRFFALLTQACRCCRSMRCGPSTRSISYGSGSRHVGTRRRHVTATRPSTTGRAGGRSLSSIWTHQKVLSLIAKPVTKAPSSPHKVHRVKASPVFAIRFRDPCERTYLRPCWKYPKRLIDESIFIAGRGEAPRQFTWLYSQNLVVHYESLLYGGQLGRKAAD